jgi:hypothetical protein
MAYVQDFAVYIIDNECVSIFSAFRNGWNIEDVIAQEGPTLKLCKGSERLDSASD